MQEEFDWKEVAKARDKKYKVSGHYLLDNMAKVEKLEENVRDLKAKTAQQLQEITKYKNEIIF